MPAEHVDRRVVDGDDQDVAVLARGYRLHFGFLITS
jgi:hypothetical protein